MSSNLIGRAGPAGLLRAAIASDRGALVLVTGEAGIGKTALLAAAVAEAAESGALVAAVSCWRPGPAAGHWPWQRVLQALPGPPAVAGDDPGVLVSRIAALAQDRPLLLVLDDLEHAGPDALRVLEFVARHVAFDRVVLLAACRDPEPGSALAPLSARATLVPLTGLSRADVGELMTRLTGEPPEDCQVAALHRRTGGNPAFVEQAIRFRQSTGSETSVAPGIMETVRARLASLPPPVVRTLSAAAVLGLEFQSDLLPAMTGDPALRIGRLLDTAVGARLLVSGQEGQFSFVHGVVRETLCDQLGEDEIGRLHLAAVEAYTRVPGWAGGRFSGELAHHVHHAGERLDRARALRYLLSAARDPGRKLASAERVRHYRRALELVDDQRARVKITLDLAHELQLAGEQGPAWQVFQEAATLARKLDDPELMARAALTLYRGPGADEALLAEAHGRLFGDLPGQPAAAVLANGIAERITGLARREGDDEALGFGLSAQHDLLWGPGTALERERLAEELTVTARRTADAEMEQYATDLRWVALLELGDPRYADYLDRFVALAASVGGPEAGAVALADRSIAAALAGHFAEAEELLDEVSGRHTAFMVHHLRWALLLQQGRFGELARLHGSLGRRDYPFPQLIEAITAVEAGDHDSALRFLAEVPAGPEPFPRMVMPLWLRFLAQVAAATRDPELCARARAGLRPFQELWLVSLHGGDVSGPVALWLAALDAAGGDWDAAIAGFGAARRQADLLSAVPWSLEARAGLANALMARRSEGDLDAGLTLLDEVEEEAARIGMRGLAERARRIRAAGHRPDAEFRHTGEVWQLAYAGRTIHMPATKGLRDLHTLLGAPGTAVPATVLLSGGMVPGLLLGADEILDETAKSRYKARLAELDALIDQATERGDVLRAAEADRERDALLGQLRAAAGLSGRSRRLGDEAERARKTVTARIRDTLRKLDDRHPALATHLRETVTTGSTCTYRADPAVRWLR
ncbi:AAA family ATPase [Amycolatopsis speibonae]|uniref:AAA family ATPase n=1 Tax=Amycolatopsis speibonae TaxID=1450224 RepID=A0ABV7P8T1_9PSEU